MGIMKKLASLFGLASRSKKKQSIASKYLQNQKLEGLKKLKDEIFVKSKHLLGKMGAKYNRRVARKAQVKEDHIVYGQWVDEQDWYTARDKAKRKMISEECREMTQKEIRALRVSFAN